MAKDFIVIYYGEVHDDEFVFILRKRALWLARAWEASQAPTWGEFRKLAPRDLYSEAVERHANDGGRRTRDTPFRFSEWFENGVPGWAQQEMLEWMPPAIIEDLCAVQDSALDGETLVIGPEHVVKVVAALEALGFRCERDEELVKAAEGY